MKSGHPQICLYQPEIPQNVGNIARVVAGTAARLHLVKPFGFSTNDRNLRRPGLDYWPFLDLEIHDSLDAVLELHLGRVAFLSKSAEKIYTDIPQETQLFVFGRETTGLPVELRRKFPDHFYRIPIFHEGVRSLNLANSVSIVIYDQLRKRQLLG
jgi:tRNA (cytidine/uridine-2'-O-)-methyltransferase